MMYAWAAVASLGGFAYPPITALMSGRVAPSEPGALQGSFLVAHRVLPARTVPSQPSPNTQG